MRLLKKFAVIGLLAFCGTQVSAAPNINTTTVMQDEVTDLSGAEYTVYMRKMNMIQKIIEQGNSETQAFMQAMNEAQGSTTGEDIPASPSNSTTVRIYSDYQTLLDDPEVTDDVKNMMLSDFGLSINSDFTKAPPLEGKIYIDDFLSTIAVERTANAYSTEPQPALVSMNDLFDEYGLEDMVAGTPDEKYARALKHDESDTGFGFITTAHASGWFDLDKSKIKTESQRKAFNADELLGMLGGISDNAELVVEGELKVRGDIYLGLVYKERTWAGIPYKWYFRHLDAEVKLTMDQPEPAKVIGTIHWDKGGDILSSMQLFDMGFSFSGWLGPIPYTIKASMDSQIGMKYYFWLKGLIQGDIVGTGEYYGLFRCTSSKCNTVSERNTLDTGIRDVKGHVQAELSLYPWMKLGGQVNLEALFIDIAEARIQAGVAYKLAAWGYIGNDCRIDGTMPSSVDTAWMIYTNEMYWGYTSYNLAFDLASGKDPLKIGGTPGKDNWREFNSYEKGLFGIDSNTYNAARLDSIHGDVQWLDPIVEYPSEAYVGEPLTGRLVHRPCLPSSIMENTVNSTVDYGDGVVDIYNANATLDIERRYPYLTANDYQIKTQAFQIGGVKLKSAGWEKPIKIKEPSFGLGDGLNVSTIPQNSITLN